MRRARFNTSSGHHTHASLRHQLHRDTCARCRVLKIVNQLSQILDRVDVMVRRRADESDTYNENSTIRVSLTPFKLLSVNVTWGAVACTCDLRADFVAGQFTTYAK